MTSYQQIPLPDGTIIPGFQPTTEWWEAIKESIDIKGKFLLDIGSCRFAFGVLALRDGAEHVTGYEIDPAYVVKSKELIKQWGFENKTQVIPVAIEEHDPIYHDVVIFSMIIHWLQDPKKHIKRIAGRVNQVVFIYRYPQDKDEPGYRPTLDELDGLMFPMTRKSSKKLSSTQEQNIMLATYEI